MRHQMSGDGFVSHDESIAVLANPSKAAAMKRLCWCGDEPIHQKLSCALRLRILDLGTAFPLAVWRRATTISDGKRPSELAAHRITPGLMLRGWRSPAMDFVRAS